MYVIDSSIYCARFLYEDINHEKSKILLQDIENRIYVPYIVFTETITVLTYKHSKERANEFAKFILWDNRFFLIDADMLSELFFWQSIEKNLSYIDIVLSYIALQYNSELLSFDDAMMKLYQKVKNA